MGTTSKFMQEKLALKLCTSTNCHITTFSRRNKNRAQFQPCTPKPINTRNRRIPISRSRLVSEVRLWHDEESEALRQHPAPEVLPREGQGPGGPVLQRERLSDPSGGRAEARREVPERRAQSQNRVLQVQSRRLPVGPRRPDAPLRPRRRLCQEIQLSQSSAGRLILTHDELYTQPKSVYSEVLLFACIINIYSSRARIVVELTLVFFFFFFTWPGKRRGWLWYFIVVKASVRD